MGGLASTGTAAQSNFQANPAALANSNYGQGINQSMLAALAGNAQGNATAGQQDALAQMLFAQASGQGPSIAQNQLNAAAAQTQAQMAGAIASQRGINPALAARLIGQNASNMMAQQAGQSGMLRQQEMMDARGLLAQALSAQRGQDIAQQQANTGLLGTAGGLQNQQNANTINNQLGAQQINANTALGNAQMQTQVSLGNAQSKNQMGAQIVGGLAGGLGAGAAKMALGASQGAIVPGRAAVPGDSPVNDTVPARLSPGELVIPRSVVQSDPGDGSRIKSFAQAVLETQPASLVGALGEPQGYERVLAVRRMFQGGPVDQSVAYEPLPADALMTQTQNPAPTPFDSWVAQTRQTDPFLAQRVNGLVPPELRSRLNEQDLAAVATEANAAMTRPDGSRNLVMNTPTNLRPINPAALPWTDQTRVADVPLTEDERKAAILNRSTKTVVDRAYSLNREAPPATSAAGAVSVEPVSPAAVPTAQEASAMTRAAPHAVTAAGAPATTQPQQSAAAPVDPMRSTIDAQKTAIQSQADAMSAAYDAHAKALQDIEQDKKQYLDAREAKSKELRDNVANGAINPGRLFGSMSTMGKIGSAFGLILGGIGAGLTKGPNLALEVVEKAIDRDIDAQKVELGKKENALSMYLQETRDGLAARQLLKADYLDAAAAQINKVAAQAGSAKSIAEAEMAGQQWLQQARMLREQVAAMRADTAVKAADLKLRQLQFNRGMWELGLMRQGMEGGGNALNTPTSLEDARERSVTLPGGRQTFARSKEDATKYRERASAFEEFTKAMKETEDFREQHGSWGGTWGPSEAANTAESLESRLLNAYAGVMGLNKNNLPATELKLFKEMIGSPGRWSTDNFKARMQQLRIAAANAMISAAHEYTGVNMVPTAPASGAPR